MCSIAVRQANAVRCGAVRFRGIVVDPDGRFLRVLRAGLAGSTVQRCLERQP
jgi:hypothetical protein